MRVPAVDGPLGEPHPSGDDLPVRLRSLLAAERARAEARIEALTRDLADILERSSDAVRDDEHDPEGATIAFERAQVSALLEAARAKLAEVAAAQDRIASGEALVCRRCGATLPPERLLARPTTDTCVSCAT